MRQKLDEVENRGTNNEEKVLWDGWVEKAHKPSHVHDSVEMALGGISHVARSE